MTEVDRPERARRPYVAAFALSAVLVIAVAGLTVAVRGVVQSRSEAGNGINDPTLSDSDRRMIGARGDVKYLWEVGAAAELGAYLEEQLPGAPTRFLEMNIYTDYAFATSQDPADPAVAVHAEWRRDEFTTARVPLDGSASQLPTFAASDVPWSTLPGLMEQAVKRLDVTDADVRYLQIDAGLYGTDGFTMRFYVSSAKSLGGYVIADDKGVITRVVAETMRLGST
ncbi:MAG: hypothetical protein WCH93_02270 [Actinomycetota bacterium]